VAPRPVSMSRSPELSPSQGRMAPGEVLSEESFRRMISLERRRSERSQRPFVLLLMDLGRSLPIEENVRILLKILAALQDVTRETDLMGWYETNVSVGVMFTDITLDKSLILNAILSRINGILREKFTAEQFSQINFLCRLFPEELGGLSTVSEASVGLPLRHVAPTLCTDCELTETTGGMNHLEAVDVQSQNREPAK
jgi:hypothetical protein